MLLFSFMYRNEKRNEKRNENRNEKQIDRYIRNTKTTTGSNWFDIIDIINK